jgi:glutamate-1-semialdehyde 2,1-aminomutase
MAIQPLRHTAPTTAPVPHRAEPPTGPTVQIDPERIRAMTQREAARLNERTPASAAAFTRAERALVGGVPSSYQRRAPYPIYLERGAGQYIWDVDGHQYLDVHNGVGSMVQGHAHPIITEAVDRRMRLGSHFAAPTEDAYIVAELLAERWKLPRWRFVNSGSEATMDAIRLARAFTGRDGIMKIFGSYHGHHDYVMVDIGLSVYEMGDRENYPSLAYGKGIPDSVTQMTIAVPFNDAPALERRLERLKAENRLPACLIMEAALMNCGVILPEPGYLDEVRRITKKYGVLWIVDEVKTGLTVAAGGATELFGIRPDLVCLAKALGAGIPTGAIGGTDEVWGPVLNGDVYMVGTFNGNPLAMAAARANLERVMIPEAYARLGAINTRLLDGAQGIIDRYRLAAYALGIESKGVITFASTKVVDYESYKNAQQKELVDLGWLWNMNRGIFGTPGRDEEWTLSIAMSDADVDHYLGVFEEFASELTR